MTKLSITTIENTALPPKVLLMPRQPGKGRTEGLLKKQNLRVPPHPLKGEARRQAPLPAGFAGRGGRVKVKPLQKDQVSDGEAWLE